MQEGDAKFVIQVVRGFTCPTSIKSIVTYINQLTSNQDDYSFSYVNKIGSFIAHALARSILRDDALLFNPLAQTNSVISLLAIFRPFE